MHDEFDDLCLLYSSGELAGAELARFQAHRPGCARCAELLEALRASARVAELTAASLPEARSDELCGKALGGASERSAPLVGLGAWLRFAGAGALVAALAVGLHLAPERRGEDLTLAGIERDMAGLDSQVSLMDGELSDSSLEMESEIGDLESQSQSLKSQFGGM